MKKFDFNFILTFLTGVVVGFIIILMLFCLKQDNKMNGFKVKYRGYTDIKRYTEEVVIPVPNYVIKENHPYDIEINKNGSCDIIIHGVKKNNGNSTK